MKPEEFPGLQYQAVNGGSLAEEAKALEYEIFAGLGYEGKGPVMTEYEGYPSMFYVAISEGQDVVGMVRKILPGPKGLPTINSFRLDHSHPILATALNQPQACEDLASTVIKKGFRARHNFACVLNLWRLAYRDAVGTGVKFLFTAIDPIVLLHYRNVFRIHFEELRRPQDYLGAPCIPCVFNLNTGIEDPELAVWVQDGNEPR